MAYDKDILQDRHDTAKRLILATKPCRPDMHEPDEQGISAKMTGKHLDNAVGDCTDKRFSNELVVTLLKDGKPVDSFNLSSLIALARVGARAMTGKE